MEEKTEAPAVCSRCGGELIPVELLAGNGTLVATKPRSAFALGITRGSPVAASLCKECGIIELKVIHLDLFK